MNNLILIFLAVFAWIEASKGDAVNITVAVVEYQPLGGNTGNSRALNNTNNYIKILNAITEPGLDMIIYPEDALAMDTTSAVEFKMDNPCDTDKYADFFKEISCAARSSSAYIVVNIVEKEKCDSPDQSANCKNFGFFFYNTDVVFDSNGTIVARYRKYNLFGEDELDRPATAEKVVFNTTFGATFGIFTCFDILFKSPAQDLLEEKPDAVIFPSMWFSELPFLTSLQAQQMWAQAHDVKLLAAGANNPAVGSGGTGFYNGKDGSVLYDIIAEGGSKSYVYKFVKSNEKVKFNPQAQMAAADLDALAKGMDNFTLITDSSIKEYNSTVLNLTQTSNELCYDGSDGKHLCCEFTTNVAVEKPDSKKDSYTYHLVAFYGLRTFSGAYNGGVILCGIIACLNSSLSSCGQRFPKHDNIDWPLTFEEVTIKASVERNENITLYPNSLLSSIRPINASETSWAVEDLTKTDVHQATFSLQNSQNRILTFAVYGRNFALDSPVEAPEDGNSSVNPIGTSWFLLTFVLILTIFANK